MEGFKKSFYILISFFIVFLFFNVILRSTLNTSSVKSLHQKEGNMKLISVFENNGNIPSQYTCDGENSAPELTVSGVRAGTKSLALIVDDPDAPMKTWVHWVLFNIPVNTIKINEKTLPPSVRQGITDFGRVGWGGPCPPSGTHRYFFKLYALDTMLDLQTGSTKAQLERAMQGHILEKAELIGLYKRQ